MAAAITPTVPSAPASAPLTENAPHPERLRWWVLVVIGIGQLMIALDNTVTNIALPSAQDQLMFSDSDRQWVITGYSLAFGGLLLLSGRLADRFGRRLMFALGLAGFTVASIVAGLSVTFEMLLISRVVQGGFAAFIAPAALALLSITFASGKDRIRAFGVFGALAVTGSTVGLLVGGALTEFLSWRSTLFVNVLFAVPALVGAFLVLRQPETFSRRKIDILSTVTVTVGLVGVVYGCSSASTAGWTSPVTLGSIGLGVVLLAVFVFLQTRVRFPLLPLRIVLDRMRGAGMISVFIGNAALLSVVFFLAYYVQEILGYSALRTGLAFLPLPIFVVVVAAVIAPRLARRIGPKVTIPIGMVIGAIGAVLLTSIGSSSQYLTTLLPGLIVLGVGLGLIFASSTNIGTHGALPEDADTASATLFTAQQIGASVSVALLNGVATTSAAAFLAGATVTTQLSQQAQVHGYVMVFWCAAVLLLIGAAITVMLIRPGTLAHDSNRANA